MAIIGIKHWFTKDPSNKGGVYREAVRIVEESKEIDRRKRRELGDVIYEVLVDELDAPTLAMSRLANTIADGILGKYYFYKRRMPATVPTSSVETP